jgi:hypothetical protein
MTSSTCLFVPEIASSATLHDSPRFSDGVTLLVLNVRQRAQAGVYSILHATAQGQNARTATSRHLHVIVQSLFLASYGNRDERTEITTRTQAGLE